MLFLFLAISQLHAQDTFWQASDTLHKRRLTLVATGGGAVFAGSMIGLYSLWYADQPSSSFHLFNDNRDWLQMDKAGHVFSGFQISRLGYSALRWSGVDDRKAIYAGSAYAMLFLTGIEVFDGFSEGWGFSTGDMVANVVGTGLFAGQQLGWGEQRISLKFSYSSSGIAHHRPETLGSGIQEELFKDYNGQTYWLSVNPSSFFRNENTRILPWLNVAAGYSGRGMLGGSENPPFNASGASLPDFARERQYFLSLDVDFTRIHTNSAFLKALFSVLNVVKMPLPAMELSGGQLQWHWWYF